MNSILFNMFLILFSLCVISLFKLFRKGGRNRGRLPGPFALPVIGHLHLLGPIAHQALHKLSLHYGPLFEIIIGAVPCIVASSPEVAKEFLKTHETIFSNRPHMAAVDYITYGSKDFSFAPYGPYWKFMKKIIMTELLSGKTVEMLSPIRQDEISCFVNLMLNKAKEGESVDVGGELIKVTNNIISRMMMSERCSGDEEDAGEVRKLLLETAELFATFNLSDFIWFCKHLDLQGLGKKLKNVRDRFDVMMERIIKDHEEKREKGNTGESNVRVKDILDNLLDVMEDKRSEIRLTKENIKAFVLDIFTAGTDTSAFTIEWALAELINNPNIMLKAQEEIDNVVGKRRLMQASDIANLPYLQAIVKETLRLHPTGPIIVRESSEDSTVMGYKIPAKTRLFVNVWGIGRDPRHWNNPLEFRPERFIDSDEGGKSNNLDLRGQHFQFLPFGSGRRGCPGTSLALGVVHNTLGAMVQCFEWRVGGDGTVDMEEGTGLTLPRAHHLVATPVARIPNTSFTSTFISSKNR